MAERITAVIEPVVANEGFELVYLELVGQPRNPTLRLTIDKPDGVTLDDCAQVSTHVGVLLDVEDLFPGRYLLEVCSPGLERQLYKLGDYERFAGSQAKIQTFEKLEGRRTFHGEILGTDGETVVIRERELGHDVLIPYQGIRRANLVFEWRKHK